MKGFIMSPTTTREWMIKNLSKYDSTQDAVKACSKELDLSYFSVRDKVTRLVKEGVLTPVDQFTPRFKSCPSTQRHSTIIGLSIDDMREKYDALYKIEKAVKEIPEGRFIPEAEFRECVAKCEASKFRAKADLDQFNKYKGVAKGITYWGNPSDIKRLKEQGVLQ